MDKQKHHLEEIFNIEIEMEHISNDIFMSSKALKNLINSYCSEGK